MVVTHNIFANLLVSTITTICQYGEYEPNKKTIATSYNNSHDDTSLLVSNTRSNFRVVRGRTCTGTASNYT